MSQWTVACLSGADVPATVDHPAKIGSGGALEGPEPLLAAADVASAGQRGQAMWGVALPWAP